MGKKTFGISLILFFVFFFSPLSTLHAEVVRSFDTDITIKNSGEIAVQESILYDFEEADKHGIYRTIPFVKINSEGKKFTLTIDDVSVTDGKGHGYQFSVSKENEAKKLKIGDPDATVTGLHEYRISYTVKGAVTYYSDHDELYWNITGNDWTVPLETTTAQVTFSGIPSTADFKSACYVGVTKSTEQTCTGSVSGDGVSFSSDRVLYAGEGLSVVVGFPKGLVAVLEPKEVNTWFSDLMGKILGFIVILIGIIWYFLLPVWVIIRWFQRGRDPKAPMGVAHAWFSVPQTSNGRDLTPGETGTLVDERVDMKDIVATIVDFARRGYLSIEEIKKGEVYLHKHTVKTKENLQPFEQEFFDGMFGTKDTVNLKKDNLSGDVTKCQKTLYDDMVKEKFFDESPEKVRTRYTILGTIAIFTGNFGLALASFIFGRAMPRKTLLGSQTANIAKALKNFLISQDRQFAYQGKHQLLFEKMLPFAIAFGVEKIWAKRFEHMKITKPDWYDGDMRSFNSVIFVNTLSSSMHTFQSSATTTHSSSGFSSGFSGGGGGGGGGGSW